MPNAPRVFLSYARKDGEAFATALRQRLEREEPEITLWQDRARMEGGVGWWRQITEALDAVQFMALVVTEASLASDVVQKEWRYARQQGVCVYPINGAPDQKLDFGKMPRWMSNAHFYNLDKEWATFVNYLKSPCRGVRVPFMAPDLPARLVERPQPFETMIGAVLDAERTDPVATNVALYGSGGFGKTTLAAQLCYDDDVMTAFVDGVLWATLGEAPNLLAELTKMYAALTGERPGFVSIDDAALGLAQKLEDQRCLIVIDDVWDPAHLTPFLRGGAACTRLITTRQFDVALEADLQVAIDEMLADEATALLIKYLDEEPADRTPFKALAHRLGEWPLLLDLAGGALRQRLAWGDTLDGALAYLNEALDEEGAVAFDRRNAQERRQAVARSLAVSLDLLDDDERSHYRALAVFPEDVDIPMHAAETLLGLSPFKVEKLVETLSNLSLLKLDLQAGTLRLHDVMRTYLKAELDDASALHARLADAWRTAANRPDAFAWRYVAYHMAEALPGTSAPDRHRRTRQLVDLVTDPAFQQGYAEHVNDPSAQQQDLERALRAAVDDEHPEAALLVLRTAAALVQFEGVQPASLFDLARAGRLAQAEQRLDLFDPEPHWQDAVRLVLAWEAAAAGHDAAARAVLNALAARLSDDHVLGPVFQWAQAALDPHAPPPPSHLPGPPDLGIVSQILERLGGTSMTPIEPLLISGLHQMGDEAPTYLAEQDGPLLVAFAQAYPEHTTYVKQYVAAQAANAYRYYRNRSLWALIPAIAQHQDPTWVLDILRDVLTGALAPAHVDFEAALPLTLQGLQARQDDTTLQALDDDRKRTLELTEHLSVGASPDRGQGDPWAFGLRRLAALAEVYHRALDRPAEAGHLLDTALDLDFHFNFAGFRAPACLALAEGLRVCAWDDPPRLQRALDAARAAAHNIQDADFCAWTTARVTTLRDAWWQAPRPTPDLVATVERFIAAPQQAEFTPVHRIGETYERRVDLPTRLALPDAMRTASTLQDILWIYRLAPREEAVRTLNPHLSLDVNQALPEDTLVHLPDPDFEPLLAGYLGADVLSRDDLPAEQRAALLKRLVPLTINHRTAFYTLSARLLLAALPADLTTLQPLAETLTSEDKQFGPTSLQAM